MQETQGMQAQSLGWEDPLEKGMATYSSILAGKIPLQRNLAGYNPWVCKESGVTEMTVHTQKAQAECWRKDRRERLGRPLPITPFLNTEAGYHDLGYDLKDDVPVLLKMLMAAYVAEER